MEIIISNSSDKPIYEQIAMQIKSLIMNGTLSAGEALPSMRALAKDLHISVITVQRAYEDLTRDGFIETVSGKGSFVASPNKEFIQEEQLRIAEELLEKGLLEILKKNHLDMNQIEALVSIDLKKEEPAVVSLAEKYKVPFLTYSAEMLNEVEEVSSASSFVKKINLFPI